MTTKNIYININKHIHMNMTTHIHINININIHMNINNYRPPSIMSQFESEHNHSVV